MLVINQKRIWGIILFLVLLWHVFLMILPWNRFFFSSFELPPPVEIKAVTPEQLEAIRNQWNKKLLLSPDPTLENEKEIPKDSKYFSDRNIRVEKEQRAAQTEVIPEIERGKRSQSVQKPNPTQSKLSKLGVDYALNTKPVIYGRSELNQRQPDVADNGMSRANSNRTTGDQYVNEDLPLGAQNMLNAQESQYYSFYSRLYMAIGPLWQSRIRSVAETRARSLPQGEYVTQVDVVLNQDGYLVDVRYIVRSGVPEFDEAVEQSWKKISRFPNPPKELLDRNGEIHTGWTFTVRVGPDMGFGYAPPKRNY